jgi:hypothetical protein
MTELLRTNDLVLINAIEALLKGAGIRSFVADQNISNLEGSIGAFPRRVLVETDQHARARQIVVDAGLGHALPAG